ncbi:MAG: class I SAM-dependent methyltransferase [Candidatus Pelagadaptatus aseana]
MVHVPAADQLSAAEEKAIYDLHDNQVDDPGYRHFLSRLFDPLVTLLPKEANGLDFGCGPGPALAAMFETAGHRVSLYDLFYHPDKQVLTGEYDFITATEVVEHLAEPKQELERLWRLLKPGGVLGIMTKKVKSREAFSRWHYKNDLTHISFFSEQSFDYLCREWCADKIHSGSDTVIIRKPLA